MKTNYTGILTNSRASKYFESETARRIAGLTGIKVDLQAVQAAANRMADEIFARGVTDRVLLEGLTWHVVVRYARCFDTGGDGRKTALATEHLKALSPDLIQLHQGLIENRHESFGHPGTAAEHRMIVHLLPDQAGEPRLGLSAGIDAPGPIVDDEQARLIAILCGNLIDVVILLVEKAWPKLLAEIKSRDKEVIADLMANLGSHVNAQQAAIAALQNAFDVWSRGAPPYPNGVPPIPQ